MKTKTLNEHDIMTMEFEISSAIFLPIYLLTVIAYFWFAYKMHKKHDSNDPFHGSHIVVAICSIGLIPVMNTLIGAFALAVMVLKWDKRKTKNNKL